MNILELSAYFYPHRGGIECVIYNLGKQWTKKNSNKVTVITSDQCSQNKHDIMQGMNIHYLRSFTLAGDVFFYPICIKIHQLNKKHKFDIALIHHPHPFILFFGAYHCKRNNIPYCVHMHGRELCLDGIKRTFTKVYNRFLLKYTLSNAEKIFICVDKIKNQSKILQKYKHKIVTIPHGIDFNDLNEFRTNKSKQQLKEQLKLENKKIILYFGVLRDYKRLDILIRAMPKIIKNVPNTVLLIVGNGPEEKRLKDLTNKLNLNKHIIFSKRLSDKDKYEYLKASDLFILPSPTIMESFGIVILESILTKTPFLVTNGAGISEIFKKIKINSIVKPFDTDDMADKAIKLLKDPKLANSLANKSYKLIKKEYQWNIISKTYLKVFKDVIKNRNKK